MKSVVSTTNQLIELPFGLLGHVFGSPMPFGFRDRDGNLFDQFQAESVNVVVLLADHQEVWKNTGRDLSAIYKKNGMKVIYLPIPDYGTPDIESLRMAVLDALKSAHSAKNVVVHCNAGIGRTGLFLACMAITEFNLPAEEAIQWVRRYFPNALEVPEQVQLAFRF